MAPFLLLLFLLSEAASDNPNITVHPGDNVTLKCHAAGPSITVLKWIKPDLEPEYVLFYRGNRMQTANQNKEFKGRVELVDRDLKEGDMSLILKNVSSIHNGTYECRVKDGVSRRKKRAADISMLRTIRTIHLQVTERGSEDGISSPVGLIVGLVAGVLILVVVAVGGVLMYKRRKNKRSGQPADDADEASAVQFI
ncbi:butyrophilin subfamily 2 member A2-like [Perca flavescens]|uniref:butyrophilin subfamily 2 member A2-like n=1 Tax=Perca flavescens TaxID=8167 RepID=UPI00106EB1A4|nr:butyrophilin subfamily 2 member A2-like [Perca flavescens]